MNPNLVKSALLSIGIHLSVLLPFFHTVFVSNPPAVDLAAGMSSVELEWVEPSAASVVPKEPDVQDKGEEPEEAARRPASPLEQWLQDAGVVRPSNAPGAMLNPAPLYPRVARQQGWEGNVVIRALVSPSGAIASARVASSSGHTSLDGAALSAVEQWRFRPARRKGQAVASQVEVPITFKLKQRTE